MLLTSFMSKMAELSWIIDCDPGCDDALALALAAQRLGTAKVEVHTVAGNVGVDLTTWNALRVIASCRLPPPSSASCKQEWTVYRGCSRSLSGEAIPAASVHGRDGLGDVPNDILGAQVYYSNPSSAVERLLAIRRDQTPFVLVCIGPLTNLASALNLMSSAEQESFWIKCQHCVVMGGAFETSGNITAAAEFNCHFDPVALHLVLESWRETAKASQSKINPIYFVPLDVTETVGIPVPLSEKNERKKGESPAALFLRASLRKYGMFHARFCRRPRGKNGALFEIRDFEESSYLDDRTAGKSGLTYLAPFCYLHDPLAVWAALDLRSSRPTLGWEKESHISVDIGSGLNRGRILIHRQREKGDRSVGTQALGTRVNWLSPKKFTLGHRKRFVNSLKRLLGLEIPKSRTSRDKRKS